MALTPTAAHIKHRQIIARAAECCTRKPIYKYSYFLFLSFLSPANRNRGSPKRNSKWRKWMNEWSHYNMLWRMYTVWHSHTDAVEMLSFRCIWTSAARKCIGGTHTTVASASIKSSSRPQVVCSLRPTLQAVARKLLEIDPVSVQSSCIS